MADLEVLLTGGAGLVGSALRRLAPPGWRISAPPRAQLDITDAQSVATAMRGQPWDLVINAAAYTAVDRAQADADAAWRANADGPATLAGEAAARNAPLLHLSTDYVFDGAKTGLYAEDDPVAPLSVYGASKAAGEQAVRAAGGRHMILRTGWLVSRDGGFATTILRLAAEVAPLRVVDDQSGCPTSADDLAAAIAVIGPALARGQTTGGVYHFVNSGVATWRDLAQAILAAATPWRGPPPPVEPISTADYGAAAPRPRNSALSTAKYQADFGVTPRPWQAAVTDVVEAALAG